MADARPLPTLIGPAENALRALLTRTLSATRINNYTAWVILNAASGADAAPGGHWKSEVADALKVEIDDVDGALLELRVAGLIDGEGALTVLGASELARGRAEVSAATARIVQGIGDDDQMIARRVLTQVRRNAEELLRR